LGELGTTFTGLSGKSKGDFGHGDARFITYMNVFSNPIADLSMTESVEIDFKQNCVTQGDVFFTTSSETPEEVGMSCVMPENIDNMYLNSFCFGYRPIEKFDLSYLAYALRSTTFRKGIIFLAQGISRYNISKNKAMDLEISVPSLEEQGCIGRYFNHLDNLITLHQRKYDKLVNVKKAMLEKMFPKDGADVPEIRFKGFTEAWEQCKLGEVLETRRGLTYRPSDVCQNGIRVLRSSNINSDSFVISEDDVFVNRKAINIAFAKENDILITAANGSSKLVGKHAIIRNIQENSVVHGGFMLLGTSKEPYFINASMATLWYRKFIDLFVAGGNGAIGNLNKTDLDNQEISIPSKEEQKIIGLYFKHIDNLITLHQRKLLNLV